MQLFNDSAKNVRLLGASCTKTGNADAGDLRGIKLKDKKLKPLTKYEDELLRQINEYRKSKGLGVVQKDKWIHKNATQHTEYQIKKNKISHDKFQERAKIVNKKMMVENVLFSELGEQPTAQSIATKFLNMWINSPGHNKNLLKADATIGAVSIMRNNKIAYYSTMLFCK